MGNPINQLNYITDGSGTNLGAPDVASTNYQYDQIGELSNERSPLRNLNMTLRWTPYGKVDSVLKYNLAGNFTGGHAYLYDGMGNQVRDELLTPNVHGRPVGTDTTYHVYDGHNVQLAEYHIQAPGPGYNNMVVMERYLYGSERLGTIKGVNLVGSASWWFFFHYYYVWGAAIDHQYELHDHLGNVRATVQSTPPPHTGIVGVTDYYNYYAFGSYEPYRTVITDDVSAGFNGQQKKDDYLGAGNENHALYWEYETRIGKRWNRDPKKNPSLSDYAVMMNSPIWHNDPLGDTTFRFDLFGKFIGTFPPVLVFFTNMLAQVRPHPSKNHPA